MLIQTAMTIRLFIALILVAAIKTIKTTHRTAKREQEEPCEPHRDHLFGVLHLDRPSTLAPVGFPEKMQALIEKPWVFIRVPYMNPTIWGL